MSKKTRKMKLKNLVWLFVLACFIGYIIEILFCMVWYGKIENRQGVIYGPFIPIYGVGAIILYLVANPVFKRGWFFTFVVSALACGGIEFIGSYFEELLFGTRSWDFNNHFLNINGRTSVPMMLSWGVLGCAYIKWIYPFIYEMIDNFKLTQSNIVCVTVVAFFLVNFTISGLAVDRWMERIQGQEPESYVDVFLDNVYTDSRMEFVYTKTKPIIKTDTTDN